MARFCAWCLALSLLGCVGAPMGGAQSPDGGDPMAPSGGTGAPDLETTPIPPPPGDGGTPPPPAKTVLYVGGYSSQIALFSFDTVSGELSKQGSTPFGGAPSFLAVDRTHRWLYAVDESNSQVGAFAIDPASGALQALGAVAAAGSGPAHLMVDPGGKWVLVANYGDGVVASLPIKPDGSLGAAAFSLTAGHNAHMALVDDNDRFVWVPCLGSDYVAQYQFDALGGKLTPNQVATVSTSAGAGPRHLALAPGGKLAYLINESNSTITALAVDGATGRLTPLQTLSTLPPGASAANNTGAEIWVHPSGRFLYGSNRGDDSIVVFSLDGAGKMSFVTTVKSGGATPRDFTLDASGSWLVVANQGSGNVVVFAIDAKSGAPQPTGKSAAFTMPSFVGLVPLWGG